MRVLILAGGLGTRLKAVVQSLPKPMAPIQNRPFLEYLIDYWSNFGLTDFYLSIGHLAEKISTHFSKGYKGLNIHFIQEPKPLGTGGGLVYALRNMPQDEDVIVINGDTYFEIDFEVLKNFHQKNNSKLTIALREVEHNDRYSGVELNQNHQIQKFALREENSKHLLINAGVYLVNPSVFADEILDMEKKVSLEDDLFPKLLQKINIFGSVHQGRFIDIGIPKDYQKAQTFLIS